MIKILHLLFCFYFVSCKTKITTEEKDPLPKASIVKGMSCEKIEELFNDKIDLKMVAIGRTVQERDSDTIIYYGTLIKHGIRNNFSFNKEKRLLEYSIRISRNAEVTSEKHVLPADIKWGMSYDEVAKLYPSEDTNFVKIIEDFMDPPPLDTVCYLYHCGNLIFEFDGDIKLYSINLIVF